MLNLRVGCARVVSFLFYSCAISGIAVVQAQETTAELGGEAINESIPANQWQAHLTFLASFDKGWQADIGGRDKRVQTAKDLNRKQYVPENQIKHVQIVEKAGRYGHAVSFTKKTSQTLFYWGDSVGYRPENWSGTLSVWMKLDPNTDLRPGYCDPVLLTDKQWDQSAMFIDFDKDLPRDFRLGVFPDYDTWNPKRTPWDAIAVDQRPMVVVKSPPFSASQWTHVCFTWQDANRPDNALGQANLYVNGQAMGIHRQVLRYTWDLDKVVIQLGIHYIGLMDELATFDVALTPQQIKKLYELPEGLAGVVAAGP
ncbi:MAG TPA: hypothetical protein DCF63_13810 [Planctomycetaceae bacterium]|nr:hypothetical protein [Planctomycetaceae bacterium]